VTLCVLLFLGGLGASSQEDALAPKVQNALREAERASALLADTPEHAAAAQSAALWALDAAITYLGDPQADPEQWAAVEQALRAAGRAVGPMRAVKGVLHVAQANQVLCATACARMVLRYHGIAVTEEDILKLLDGSAPVVGVHVSRMRDIATHYGLSALIGEGSPDLIRCALALGYPVLVYQYAAPGNDVPHMRVVVGFDDTAQVYHTLDPAPDLGPNNVIPYPEFEALWRLPWREDDRSRWMCVFYRKPEATP